MKPFLSFLAFLIGIGALIVLGGQQVLAACGNTEMQFAEPGAESAPATAAPPPAESEGNRSNSPLRARTTTETVELLEGRRVGTASPRCRAGILLTLFVSDDNDEIVCE